MPVDTWLRRLCALIGALTVLPWLLFSVQGLRDDAADMPREWAWLVLVAQLALTAAFLANWWQWRAGPPVLLAAIAGYAGAVSVAAAYNDGTPLLAAILFAGTPMLAAVPVVLPGLFQRGSARSMRPTPTSL